MYEYYIYPSLFNYIDVFIPIVKCKFVKAALQPKTFQGIKQHARIDIFNLLLPRDLMWNDFPNLDVD
jgi:hypothetical protein